MSMDAVLEYIKHNILSIIAIMISLYALYQTHRGDKSGIKREIAKKKAELKVLKSNHHFTDSTTANNTMLRIPVLEKEIEELEKRL